MRIRGLLCARTVIAACALAATSCTGGAGTPRATEPGWEALWNGRDLKGWQAHVTHKPTGSHDPGAAFSATTVDGMPAIRIASGAQGGLGTVSEFGNYHLRFEYKWGRPGKDNSVRDSGFVYHADNPRSLPAFDASGFELQIRERSTGDFFALADALAEVRGRRLDAAAGSGPVVHDRLGQAFTIGRGTPLGNRTMAGDDDERPGEWNAVELLVAGRTAVHVVNGHATMVAENLRRRVDGDEEPVTRGRLYLVAQGSEIFFRDLSIRPLPEIPAQYLR